MFATLALGQLLPLLTVATYRRAGRRWRSSLAAGAMAVALSLLGGVIATLPLYIVTVNHSLCGHFPVIADVVAALGYVAVAAWALLRPGRLWAWPVALWLALALQILVALPFDSAHGFCET